MALVCQSSVRSFFRQTFMKANKPSMRIGIDAKWFFSGPPSGVVVVRNMVRHLIALNCEDELFLFLDRRDRDKPFPFTSAQVHLHYVWADNNLIANLLLIPVLTYGMKLDVMIFQNFAPLFSNCKRISFVFDVIFKSNPEYFTLLERLYFLPMRLLTNKSHRVCTISESEKRRMVQLGFAREDMIDVVHLGIDDDFVPRDRHDQGLLRSVEARYGLPATFILYVGRLNIRKNIFNLLRALALLDDKTIPLVIVGAYDWKMTSVEATLDELGIRDRVIFTGSVESGHIPAIFALATIFAYPSFEEGFGLPPLEAMASGVPVVVSDSSSLPEVCGKAGNYVDPNDPAGIARMIDLLLTDSGLYDDKRTEGLLRSQRFSWDHSARSLLECIKKTVAGSAA